MLEDGQDRLFQSLAILEYLEETHPEPPLLPADPAARSRVRALAQVVACEIHPLNNLRVLGYLTGELEITEEAKQAWYRHWIAEGLGALEAILGGSPDTGRFCHGDTPGLADVCLDSATVQRSSFRLSAFGLSQPAAHRRRMRVPDGLPRRRPG